MSTSAKVEDELATAVAAALEDHPEVAYAVIFGSRARSSERKDSDLDIALGLRPEVSIQTAEIGALIADLEAATKLTVDLILMDEAPPALAFRVFREGRLVVSRDHRLLVARRARAILDYLDFRPCEESCAQGVLRAAAHGG